MSDQKISELTAITGANTADDDLLVIVDTSTGETKKITKAELTTTINNALIDGAPATLDTLNELAAALADDANFASTVTTSLAGKVDTTGDSMTGDLTFGDNDKAIFGAGSDLQIYHEVANGSSYIKEVGTGNLYIQADNIILESNNGENYFQGNTDGSAYVYHNGVARLATTSTGIDVTGTATMDGLTVDGSTVAPVSITSTNAGNQIKLSSSSTAVGGEWYAGVSGNASDDFIIYQGSAGAGNIVNYTEGTQRQTIANNGDISFYEDTGTTAKFFWDASAESLGIGTSAPSAKLEVSDSVNNDLVTAKIANTFGSTTSVGSGTAVQFYGWDAGVTANIKSIRTGAPYSPSALTFETFGGNGTGGTNTLAERMRIDDYGNVGIGTSSPSSPAGFAKVLKVEDSSSASLVATADGTTTELGSSSSGGWLGTSYNDPMRFVTNGSERMRIDSSGNLLVGKTAISTATVGHQLLSSGLATFTRDGGEVQVINRLSSDGDIVQFRKDGTTVGSIGNNTDFYIASQDGTGVRFTNTQILPCSESGALQNNSRDLGASTARFKDLYLSGGVYLGGTGAANHLDDYEEGTWTPEVGGTTTSPSVTYTYRNGYYTKVGQLVSVHFRVLVSSISGGSGLARIINLPFTVASASNGHVQTTALSTMSGAATYNGGFAEPASNWIYLNASNGNTFDVSTLGTGIFWASLTYRVS